MTRKKVKWLFGRLFAMIAVVFLTLTATFFLVHTIRGDPFTSKVDALDPKTRQQYILRYGTDKSILEQYAIFLRNLAKGDLGVSLSNNTSTVNDVIRNCMPSSLIVGSISYFLSFVLGFLAGIVCSYSKNKLLRSVLITLFMLGISIPVFIVAPVYQQLFSVKLGILPASGWGKPENLVLPIISMIPITAVHVFKHTKNGIKAARNSGYYRAAKQRGFSEIYIFKRHILKNASPALLTVIISGVSGLFTGAFVIEKVFAIPGIGFSFVTAISKRDYPIILGLNIAFTGIYVIFILLGDIIQALLFPRFKEGQY